MPPRVDTRSRPPPGLWSIFRGRALELRTMGHALRVVTLIAVAQIALGAVLLTLRNVPWRTTPLLAGTTGVTTVPLVVLWATVGFMVLAWGYLLYGAFQAQPEVALVGLAAFGAALVPLVQDIGWHGAPGALRVLALLAIAGVALRAWRVRRRRRVRARAVGTTRLVVLIALVAVVYGTFAWDALADSSFGRFSFGLADQLMTISFFLLPFLLLTGEGFAEWAEVVGDRLASASRRLGSPALMAVLAAAIAVAVLVHVLLADAAEVPSGLVLIALAGLIVVWVARRAQPRAGWTAEIPWLAIALVAFAFVGVLLVEVYRTTPGPAPASAAGTRLLHPYFQSTHPRFRISYPDGWQERRLAPGEGETLVQFTGEHASLYVMAGSAHGARGEAGLPAQLLHRLYPQERATLGVGKEDRGWRRTEFSVDGKAAGLAWDRPIGGSDWLLLGASEPGSRAVNRKVFQSMWLSFAVRSQPIPSLSGAQGVVIRRLDPYRYDPVLVVPFLVWLAVAVACGFGLVWLGPMLSSRLALGAVFVLVFAVLFVLSDLRQVVEEIVDGHVAGLYSLRLPGIQAAVSVATLVVLGALLVRGRLTERAELVRDLVVLVAGLQLLVWMSYLYRTASLAGSRLSIAQGLVILAALLWEMIVSGEQYTNRHTRGLPRPTRVLVLCGYLMLVATAVMFFSSFREYGTGAPVEPQFESETWPALGIVQLGVPLLLCVAAVRLGVFSRARSRVRPPATRARATAPIARPRVEQQDAQR